MQERQHTYKPEYKVLLPIASASSEGPDEPDMRRLVRALAAHTQTGTYYTIYKFRPFPLLLSAAVCSSSFSTFGGAQPEAFEIPF